MGKGEIQPFSRSIITITCVLPRLLFFWKMWVIVLFPCIGLVDLLNSLFDTMAPPDHLSPRISASLGHVDSHILISEPTLYKLLRAVIS